MSGPDGGGDNVEANGKISISKKKKGAKNSPSQVEWGDYDLTKGAGDYLGFCGRAWCRRGKIGGHCLGKIV